MRRFLAAVTRYPMVTVLLIVLVGLLGVYSAVHMPVDLFPPLGVPVVNVVTHHVGATPEDVEILVSRTIENGIRPLPGVKRVASASVQGISQVTVMFEWGTSVRDARQLVQGALARIRADLPAGVEPRIESIDFTLQEVCGYVVYGAGDPIALRNTIRYDLAGRLESVAGVSSVQVLGGERRAFHVTLRPSALSRFHLTLGTVVAALESHNVGAAAGFLERSGREYLVRVDARLRTLDDLRRVPVGKSPGGLPVLLGSVATVSEGRAPKHYTVRGDGRPAVALIVRKQPGADTTRVVSRVDRALTDLRRLLPEGARVEKFYDQSEIIVESRGVILDDLLVGGLFAVLVLYFFLGSLRPTLIVAVTIPLTLLATVGLMRLFGLGFNVITMTALGLAIGMIVDDAIVVSENIHRHGGLVPDPLRASIEGAAGIAGPDASGTFTTVAAFLPLIIVSGPAALFLRPFGLTVGAALVVSLVLSLTLVPLLFSRARSVGVPAPGFPGARVLRLIDCALRAVLGPALRHPRIVAGLSVLTLGFAAWTSTVGRVSVLPPIDEGAILVEYVMPPGTSLAESDRVGDSLDRIALAEPGVACVYRRTGSPEGGYQVEGVNKGELLIKLRPRGERGREIGEIMDALRAACSRLDGVVLLYHQPTQEKIDESLSGLPAVFAVTVYGPEVEELVALAGRVEGILSRDPAVTDVVNNTKIKASQVDVRVDAARAARFGVEPAEVMRTLQAVRGGVPATRIVRRREQVPVLVRLEAEGRSAIDRLRMLPVSDGRGTEVLLGDVADVLVRHTPASITRVNGQRAISVVAEVEGSIPAAVARLRREFAGVERPPGYGIGITGQYPAILETALELLIAALCAVVLIYLIMVMQFRSWLQPLVILITVPVALVGALLALSITGLGLDVSVGMGSLTLVGIAVNNAIVLIDHANRRLPEAREPAAALMEAASVRLRPILLTSLTTIAALLPTALESAAGSQVFRPFAVTVIGGLLSALPATLIVVPALARGLGARLPRRAARGGGETALE